MNNIFVCINIYKDINNNIAFTVEDISGNYINSNTATKEEKEAIIECCNKVINHFK